MLVYKIISFGLIDTFFSKDVNWMHCPSQRWLGTRKFARHATRYCLFLYISTASRGPEAWTVCWALPCPLEWQHG